MTELFDLPLDPGLRAWIDRIQEYVPTLPGLGSTDPAVRRAADLELSNRLSVEFALPVPDGVSIDDHEIAGAVGPRCARRYRADAASGPQPTQLWLHGGGFYAGAVDEILNDRLCARLALESGVQIISLDYRLAPENPYPAAVLDTVAALRDIRSRADELGVDPERLGVGGNSAGAAIAASAAIHARDAGNVPIHHQDLEVIPAAFPPVGPSAQEFARGFGLDDIGLLADIYLGQSPAPHDAAFVLDVDDLSGLPHATVTVAEWDVLRDSGIAYADRLEAAGVPVLRRLGEGQLHGSFGLTARMPGALLWQQQHARDLAAAYGVG